MATPQREVEQVMPGLKTWLNPLNGFRVVDLEFRADPLKRSPEWETQSRKGVPTAEWNREFGSQWIVYDGKPVYGDFDEDIHKFSGSIVVPRGRWRLLAGWDGGPNDVNLGWVLGLVSPEGKGVQFIDEYYADDGDTEDFVQVVGSRLRMEWARLGGYAIHVADQSVFTKSGVAGGKAMADLMRQHGMAPSPGEISFSKRRAAVERLLVYGPRNPRFLVHERCRVIVEGMMGGYAYGRSNIVGGGQYKETPLKNKFSHVMNAVEYVCSRLDLVSYDVPYEGRRLPRLSVV